MIEGIKKIREALRKITTGLRKDGTINVHPECESYIKEKLEEGERHTNKKNRSTRRSNNICRRRKSRKINEH